MLHTMHEIDIQACNSKTIWIFYIDRPAWPVATY